MNAAGIAAALKGKRAGSGRWMARCPAHEDRKPSLSISSGRDGKVLVRCHAGCSQGDVIAILRQRGLWETTRKSRGRFARQRQDRVSDEPDADALKRSEAAQAIWQASQPAEGTPVAAGLRSRGLALPAARDSPNLTSPTSGHHRRLDRKLATTTTIPALTAMRGAESIHLQHHAGRALWSLSGGQFLSADVATILTNNASVAPVSDALFPTYRGKLGGTSDD